MTLGLRILQHMLQPVLPRDHQGVRAMHKSHLFNYFHKLTLLTLHCLPGRYMGKYFNENSFIKCGWNSGYKTFNVHSSCSLQVADQCLKTRYFDFASLQSTLHNKTVFMNAR